MCIDQSFYLKSFESKKAPPKPIPLYWDCPGTSDKFWEDPFFSRVYIYRLCVLEWNFPAPSTNYHLGGIYSQRRVMLQPISGGYNKISYFIKGCIGSILYL